MTVHSHALTSASSGECERFTPPHFIIISAFKMIAFLSLLVLIVSPLFVSPLFGSPLSVFVQPLSSIPVVADKYVPFQRIIALLSEEARVALKATKRRKRRKRIRVRAIGEHTDAHVESVRESSYQWIPILSDLGTPLPLEEKRKRRRRLKRFRVHRVVFYNRDSRARDRGSKIDSSSTLAVALTGLNVQFTPRESTITIFSEQILCNAVDGLVGAYVCNGLITYVDDLGEIPVCVQCVPLGSTEERLTITPLILNELSILKALGSAPHIVRNIKTEQLFPAFTSEELQMTLESFDGTLWDIVHCSRQKYGKEVDESITLPGFKDRLDAVVDFTQTKSIWKLDVDLSSVLIDLMRDIAEAVHILHSKQIVHGYLNPRNILISLDSTRLRARVHGFALSTIGLPDSTLLGKKNDGWQWPNDDTANPKRDVFSLGLLFYYIATGVQLSAAKMPLDLTNIKLEYLLHDLIGKILQENLMLRPKASEVVSHVLFWSSKKLLNFMVALSDLMETQRALWGTFESHLKKVTDDAHLAAGTTQLTAVPDWLCLLSKEYQTYLSTPSGKRGPKVKYTFTSLKSLIRLLRNTNNHINETTFDLQNYLVSQGEGQRMKDGLAKCFKTTFPSLLLVAHNFAKSHFGSDAELQQYF